MKKYYLFIPLALLLLFSSCSSLRIEKRHYNKGFYVDFGNDKKTSIDNQGNSQDEVAVVEKEPQPVQENADRAITDIAAAGSTVQNPALASVATDNVVNEPTQTESTSTKTDQQDDATQARNNTPENAAAPEGDVGLVLLVILAIILPPLAVYLVEGTTTVFWIDLICWLIGGVFFFGRFGYGYIGGLGLLAVVLALLVVFDVL